MPAADGPVSDCPSCGRPGLFLRAGRNQPPLETLEEGDWARLRRCPRCGELWLETEYPPFSFLVRAAWPESREVFRLFRRPARARVLHEWADAMLRRHAGELPPAEAAELEAWRERTGRRHNPLDEAPEFREKPLVAQPEDLPRQVAALRERIRLTCSLLGLGLDAGILLLAYETWGAWRDCRSWTRFDPTLFVLVFATLMVLALASLIVLRRRGVSPWYALIPFLLAAAGVSLALVLAGAPKWV